MAKRFWFRAQKVHVTLMLKHKLANQFCSVIFAAPELTMVGSSFLNVQMAVGMLLRQLEGEQSEMKHLGVCTCPAPRVC